MKKFLVVAVLFIAVSGMAQKPFKFGIKAGANLSNFNGITASNVESKMLVGFYAGGYLKFNFTKLFSLQPELLFSNQGATIESGTSTHDYKVSYINIPVIAKVNFPGGMYVEAGPQVGFKVNENTTNNSINSFAKDLDLSVAGGLGYKFPMGFGIGARYTASVGKAGEFDTGSPTKPDFKNGVLQIGLFIPFK
jgi:hypothetical protein